MSGPTQNVGLKDQAGADALGMVDASPADNTILGRLKAIVTSLGGVVLAAGSAIIGKVGIDQTTPGTTNGVQVNAALPAGTNLIGQFGVDQTTPGVTNGVQVNAPLPAGTNLIGKVGFDQTTPGTTDSVTAKGLGVTVSVDKTRPADTNAYAAGDVISTATSGGASVLEFENVVRASGGSGYIMGGVLIDSASPGTALDAELWLFDTAIASGNDNAAFAPTDAEIKTLVAVMEFAVGKVKVGLAGGNNMYHGRKNGEPWTPEFFSCVGGTSLFGYLVVRNAYTPISAEVFTVRLKIAQVT